MTGQSRVHVSDERMSSMKKLMIAALLALPAPALAQGVSNERVLVIFGADPCPRDTICVQAPESERYRIPKNLRNSGPISPQNQSWAARAARVDSVGRSGTGSCSTSGAGGWTGCYMEQMRAARAERKAAAVENAPGLDN
jgi:hypothetical protein